MKAYRIAQAKHATSAREMVSGDGAMQWGGRWNSPGIPAVYCSENLSLCALEILVHLPPRVMRRYHCIELTVPDALIAMIDSAPDDELESREIGDGLLGPDGELAFTVPSRVNSFERNLIFNPLHARVEEVTYSGDPLPFPIDERLLR